MTLAHFIAHHLEIGKIFLSFSTSLETELLLALSNRILIIDLIY